MINLHATKYTLVALTTLAIIAVATLYLYISSQLSPTDAVVNGIVKSYDIRTHTSNTPVGGVKVRLYSYKENTKLPYLPPLGRLISETTTDQNGKYEIRVPKSTLESEQWFVVYVDPSPLGWKKLDLRPGVHVNADLVYGGPVPS